MEIQNKGVKTVNDLLLLGTWSMQSRNYPVKNCTQTEIRCSGTINN